MNIRDNWAESFAALVNAYEQINSSNTEVKETMKKQPSFSQESSSSSHVEQPRQNKRKLQFEDMNSNKSLRVGLNQFCSRFVGSVVVTENRVISSPRHLQPPEFNQRAEFSLYMINYFENLGQIHRMDVDSIRWQWQIKKGELESNLAMIINGFPTDSYDDARLLVLNVVDCANWLCGENYDELARLVPMFKLHQDKISQLKQFIKIIEDVRDSQFPQFTSDLTKNCERVLLFLSEKKEIYGNTLHFGSIAWKVLGFPVDEVDAELKLFQEKIVELALNLLRRTQYYAQGFNIHTTIGGNNWERFSSACLDTMLITTTVLQIAGGGSYVRELISCSATLCHLFLLKTDQCLKLLVNSHSVRFPDSRLCCMYESIIQLFKYVSLIPSDANIKSCNDDMECDETKFSYYSNLYHVSIELGLELCEFCSKKRPTLKKFQPMVLSICKRYMVSLAILMQDVLDSDTATRVSLMSS